MGIPDEDLGPTWLRDRQAIEADIRRLGDLAEHLRAEVERNYVPHLASVAEDMTVPLTPPPAEFLELVGLLTAHHAVQTQTVDQVHDYANRSGGLAAAAAEISRRYAGSDAFARSTVRDVARALGPVGPPPPVRDGGEERDVRH